MRMRIVQLPATRDPSVTYVKDGEAPALHTPYLVVFDRVTDEERLRMLDSEHSIREETRARGVLVFAGSIDLE